ncbi:hypothetical protein ZHAS_00014983 [Anopheles sinensis]|uniref:Uncharacterized protein n=1 Tax=Anopheles sinensis TaxID=74873 RepID=A0A084W9S4_ANOSI|nr:hypothetical protein ZHAS_00014983 [Anopheles sinensis]
MENIAGKNFKFGLPEPPMGYRKSDGDNVPIKSKWRGKYQRSAERRNAVKAHIFQYNPTISHYRREHAPNRLYLPTDVSQKKMFDQYLETHPALKVSYTFFCRIFQQLNISIVKLGQEECETCKSAKQHQNLLGHKDDETSHGCSVCDKQIHHKRIAEITREAYRADGENVEPNEIVLAVDLQKVIQLPRLDDFKTIVFAQRLLAFNETFAPIGKYAKSNAVIPCLWKFSATVSKAKTKVDVLDMHAANFFHTTYNVSQYTLNKCKNRPYIDKIKRIVVKKGSCELHNSNSVDVGEVKKCLLFSKRNS